jgi:hypothetical protein
VSTLEPDSDGSAWHRLIQRSIPSMSAEEHLERLRYDIDTVLQLQLRSWSDDAWEPVAQALTEYGFGVVKGWMHTGQIYAEVARTGYGALPKCRREWLNDDTIQSLAGHTVAEALNYFKFQVLMKNKWDATRGASLATFFVGQCKFQFANIYKTWHTDQAAHRKVALYDDPPTALPADGMPGDELMTEAAARVVLDQLSTPLARQVFWRKFVLGYSFQKIANDLPGIKDAKAAENLVFRERRRLKKK